MDSTNKGPVKASRVVKSKGQSAGFDYGDQEDHSSSAAAYQLKTQDSNSGSDSISAASLPAPSYDSTAINEELETETTQLKSDDQGLSVSADAPDDSGSDEQPNNTGLPDSLKSGVEGLSGVSLDDVNVHYNSTKPAQLQALAYAQGTDIHVGVGQEKHLPHEAWHVVQQKHGRVKPTMQMKGEVPVNDDEGLEKETDVMGAKALQMKRNNTSISVVDKTVSGNVAQMAFNNKKLQELMGMYKFKKAKKAGVLDDYRNKSKDELLAIRNSTRKSFDEIIEGYITRDDAFEETEPQSWLGWGLSAIGFGEAEGDKDGDISKTIRSGGQVGSSRNLSWLLADGALGVMRAI